MNGKDNLDDTPSERKTAVRRREYLKLAGTAGVIGVGSSAFVGQVGAADHQPKRTLTIEATGSRANYEFAVDGSVTHSEAMGASVGGDDIYGNKVVGHVAGSGRDSFAFTGELTSYSVDEDVLLYLNGEPLADTITIEDDPEGRRTNYEMRVDGEVLKSTAMSASIDDNDEITPRNNPSKIEKNQLSAEPLAGETYVLGGVNGATDSYVVSGDPTGFVADGRVNVYMNGEQISPAEFVRTTFTFESTNGELAEYSFSTSGDVTKSKYMGATIDDSYDSVESGGASGAVKGTRDSYAFTGEVTDFSADDNLRVYLNREEVDVATLSAEPQFENTLTVEGKGGRTDYRFAVEGELEENYGLGGSDSISGKTAEGAVTSGQDSYTFSGDIASFNIETDGEFATYLNGNEVSPETLGETQTTPDADQLPNEVSVRALTNARTEYGIGVSGTLATGDRSNTWSGDNASYEYARGWVSSEGLDNYGFSGRMTTLTDFDSIQIDIRYEDEQIVITNTGEYEKTSYKISVTGDLEDVNTDAEDSIDGGTATGTVNNGTDVYGFTGNLQEFVIDDMLRVRVKRRPVRARGTIDREYEFTSESITAEEYYVSDDLALHYGTDRMMFDSSTIDRERLENFDPELNDKFPEQGTDIEQESLDDLVGTEAEWDVYYEEQGVSTTEKTVSIASKSEYSGPVWQYKRGRAPAAPYSTVLLPTYVKSAPINVVWDSENRTFEDIVSNMKNRDWHDNGIAAGVECSSARYIRDSEGGFRNADENLGTLNPNTSVDVCLASRDHVRMWRDRDGTFGGTKGQFSIGSVHGEPDGHIFVINGKIDNESGESYMRTDWDSNTSASVSDLNLNNELDGGLQTAPNDGNAAYIKWNPS